MGLARKVGTDRETSIMAPLRYVGRRTKQLKIDSEMYVGVVAYERLGRQRRQLLGAQYEQEDDESQRNR